VKIKMKYLLATMAIMTTPTLLPVQTSMGGRAKEIPSKSEISSMIQTWQEKVIDHEEKRLMLEQPKIEQSEKFILLHAELRYLNEDLKSTLDKTKSQISPLLQQKNLVSKEDRKRLKHIKKDLSAMEKYRRSSRKNRNAIIDEFNQGKTSQAELESYLATDVTSMHNEIKQAHGYLNEVTTIRAKEPIKTEAVPVETPAAQPTIKPDEDVEIPPSEWDLPR
jgi:hypothetical protein